MRKCLFFLLGLAPIGFVLAQEDESVQSLFETKYDSPLTINLDEEATDEEEIPKKKKKKKNKKVFFGIKTKRGFTKTGYGNRQIVELFHYLKDKDFEGPDQYVQDFYWYDFKKKRIVNSTRVNREYAGVLHGHYVKKMDEQVLEEGFYYKGTKHGRWVEYNRHDILMDKKKFWKGWPKESLMSYYDFDKTKLKEVIPVHYGEKSGKYYAFHESGVIAVTGQYKFGHKVGLWREYYDNQRIKREVIYPEDPFDFKTSPIITKEWDKDGRLLYDRSRFLSSLN